MSAPNETSAMRVGVATDSDLDKIMKRIYALRYLETSEAKAAIKQYIKAIPAPRQLATQIGERIRIKSWDSDLIRFYCPQCDSEHLGIMEIFDIAEEGMLSIKLGYKVKCPYAENHFDFYIVASPYIREETQFLLERKHQE